MRYQRYTNDIGRPRFEITKESLINSYKKYLNWDKVAQHYGVSSATIYNRMREYGIKRNYTFSQTNY